MQSLLAFPLEAGEPLATAFGHGGFKIRAADSFGTRSTASILVNRRYSSRGYRFEPSAHDESPNRLTLVASDHSALVGTLTVGFDSTEEGLLADDLFPSELAALRASGHDLCEFTKLAMEGVLRSQRVLAALFHVAFIHAHCIHGCDKLLIEVNPRHLNYYHVKLGFDAIGPLRHNERVGAPAILMSLDLWYAHEQISRFGGRPEQAREERSLYPFAFSQGEEAGIVARLRRAWPARQTL